MRAQRLVAALALAAVLLVPWASAAGDETAEDLRARARKLEVEMARLHQAIADMAKKVAQLRLEAQTLDAAEKADAGKPTPVVKKRKGLWGPVVKHTVAADLTKPFRSHNSQAMAKAAGDIVRHQALADLGADNKTLLTGIRGKDVLVVDGAFDHIERALGTLGVPYTKTSPWNLGNQQPFKIDGYKIILWNCGESLGQRRGKRVWPHLRSFVEKGGFLYTTDWAVSTVLVHAFPGSLTSNGSRAHLPEMVVPITPLRGATSSLYLRGVLGSPTPAKWWLEQASFDMTAGPSFRGTALVESTILKKTFNRSATMAAVFRHGHGRVLHSMGHAYQEAGNLAGAIAAQRLLLNFILMAQIDRVQRPADGLGAKR